MGTSGTLRNSQSRAKRIYIISARGLLPCVVLALILSGRAVEGRRRQHVPSLQQFELWKGNLHFPRESAESKFGHGFKIIDASAMAIALEDESGLWSGSSRSKRATDDDPVDPNNRTTVVHLNDSHLTLLVHWAGEGSDVIMALAKSTPQTNSSLFLSKNYGKTFDDVSSRLMVDWGKRAVISNYYSTRSSNRHYVFADETNKCIFTTSNSGDNFMRHCNLPFVPRVLKINSFNPRHILAMDDQSILKQLFLTEDFGSSWRPVYSLVKSFHWGNPPYDNDTTIYVVEELPSFSSGTIQKLQVVLSHSLFHSSYDTSIVITDVVDFHIQDDYMYATKAVNLFGSNYNPHLQLHVSYMRHDFVLAQFPGDHMFTDFYVADASEGQLMVCAYINNSYSNLYVSDATGYRFSLSLERIVYFNPKTITNRNRFRLHATEAFADITSLNGVGGIYIASQQTGDQLNIEEQQSLITYDKGGSWELIKAPEYFIGNRPSGCKLASNCSLHLTQEFHRLYPGSQSNPILTQPTSPGLVIASGVMGETLKGDPDVVVSTNAGISWRQVLSGNYIYATGDHGGIIVAARQFRSTNEIVFSVDEGDTWSSYRIVKEPMRVYGVLTEPGENTTIFSIFGSPPQVHSWQIIQIDFKNVFGGKKCGPSDYKMWSVSEDLPNNYCLLGHVTTYQRRIASSICYNGDDFVRQYEVNNCTCSREDFECDFGFVDRNGSCHQDPEVRSVSDIPSDCPPGSFYSHTRGYRKVAGDSCVGGDEHRFGPLQYSCPIQERPEFLLLTLEQELSMLDLASRTQFVLVREYISHISAVFDYQMNCVIYVESAGNIKRMCLSQNTRVGAPVIIYTKRSGIDITSMAFDWTGRNIYFTDSNNTIRVVNVDGRFERTIYTVDNGVYNPRAIIVDPHHGYLLFVGGSSTSQNYSIYRASMDSSNAKVDVVTSMYVSNSTSLTIDLDTETLYWINPSTRSGYKSDIFGNSFSVLFQEPEVFHSASIGIYKNDLYIASSTGVGILMANKHNPVAWRYFAFVPFVQSMVVVSNTSQHASSACSAYHTQCSQLCLPHPSEISHNRTCLCGDGYRGNRTHSSLDETCFCESGEIMSMNRTCVLATNSTTCALDQLTCHNGHCIHSTWKCDGDNDCGDGSDEMDCEYSTCGSASFTCRSGNCIPKQWVCDQQDDCKDGLQSDELHCANRSCSHDQFRCDNNFCVSKSWVCDMDNDCHDNSDERNCPHTNTTSCPPWFFTCDSGACIDTMYKCDGHNDCMDGSDEKSCSNHNCSLDFQFYCGPEQQCIFSFWHCDGEADCANGTDELNCSNLISTVGPTRPSVCPAFSFTCRNGYCLGMINVCDGFDDCGDYSDETYCSDYSTTVPPATVSSCTSSQFFCYIDHYCISMSKKCNGHEDCHDGTDEEDCETSCPSDEYQCSHSPGNCIPRYWVCDGASDCPLQDDEIICNNHTLTCPSTEFQCPTDGMCVSMDKLCNKVLDCEDGYDEFECDYHSEVNCSSFNRAKEACCTTPECGVFTASWDSSGSGQCQNINQSQRTKSRNDCEETIQAYSCRADQFKCEDPAQTCLSFVQVCDKKLDCNNGLDEQRCATCANTNRGESSVYSTSNTSVTWKVNFNFTTLSYAEILPGLSLARLNWHNKTYNYSFTVDKLKPYTTYFFAFLRTDYGVTCVLSNNTVTTAQGIPSAPVNLTAKAQIEFYPLTYSVHLKWEKPIFPNGDIKQYTIYFQKIDANGKGLSDIYTQSIYVDLMKAFAQVFTARVTDNIQPNATYIFWVAAVTILGGPSSEKVKVQVDPTIYLNVTVTNVTETSLKLQWIKAPNATGYRVNVRFPEPGSFLAPPTNEMILLANNSQTSIDVVGLCPGTKVYVGLQVIYANNVNGPEQLPFNTTLENGEIHLKGTQPVVKFTNGDQVETSHILLKYNATAGGPVKQFYIYHTHNGLSAVVVNVTSNTSYELSSQLPCHRYTVWIRPAFPKCPFTDRKELYTKEETKAPPKNINANVSFIEQHFSLNLTWQPSCSDNSGAQEKYIIHITMNDAEKHNLTWRANSSKPELFLPYVQDGSKYTFTVQTDYTGSRETVAYSTYISSLGEPYNILVFYNGSKVTILWEYPPTTDKANNFTYFEVHVKGDQMDTVNYTTKCLLTIIIPKNGKYSTTITAKSTTGHVIGKPVSYEFMVDLNSPNNVSNNNKDISISKTNLVAILVPVGLLIVVLSAGLVVLIVRHRRLQRSFLSFANSHYNIQSGTTTFSDDAVLDGDEPLIQGFSDDEPLIIA